MKRMKALEREVAGLRLWRERLGDRPSGRERSPSRYHARQFRQHGSRHAEADGADQTVDRGTGLQGGRLGSAIGVGPFHICVLTLPVRRSDKTALVTGSGWSPSPFRVRKLLCHAGARRTRRTVRINIRAGQHKGKPHSGKISTGSAGEPEVYCHRHASPRRHKRAASLVLLVNPGDRPGLIERLLGLTKTAFGLGS